jgi:hypothetical protein
VAEQESEEIKMDITEVPFNNFVGIARPDGEPGFLLQLGDSTDYENHLGTVHASAQLALAEATSGEFLMSSFPTLATVFLPWSGGWRRNSEIPSKGRSCPGQGFPRRRPTNLPSYLQTKGRGLIGVEVEVVGADGIVGLIATVEWFVQKHKTP